MKDNQQDFLNAGSSQRRHRYSRRARKKSSPSHLLRFFLIVIVIAFGVFGTDYFTAKDQTSDAAQEQPSAPIKQEIQTQSKQEEMPFSQRVYRFIFLKDVVNQTLQEKHLTETKELPENLIQAIVSVEDARFFLHHGFDVNGILRAFWSNVRQGKIVQGGSTITQQLVKNLFLTQDQTYARKIEEFLLALDFEMRYSKKEILTLYLNSIYFGSGYYGISEAAKGYFNKDPMHLSLAESSMIAGLPNAPSVYSPYKDFVMAKRRQNIVLDSMVRNQYIDEKTAANAKVEPLFLAH